MEENVHVFSELCDILCFKLITIKCELYECNSVGVTSQNFSASIQIYNM